MENNIVHALIKKGVNIPSPDSVHIADDVNIDRISGDNVTIYTGCKIIGKNCLIMKNSQIGYEAPATLENTLVGENCSLKGGFFKQAVFAGDNSFGSGAHVREGTILEEQAKAAHSVGLKQTILFPFVTVGSLINFCDCFMSGGTSRKNHSEVGSSFVHFNYTPNQDKATPSMMGDVHNGVMLDSKPIFLGGQGGLVGPVRIGYGCTTAAGSIIRKNQLKQDQLLLGGALKEMSIPKQKNSYKNRAHIFNNNIYFIAGLISLKFWYKNIRTLFICDDFSRSLVKGMQENLEQCMVQRIYQLKLFCEKSNTMDQFLSAQSLFHAECASKNISSKGERFIKAVETKIKKSGKKYIKIIQSLEPEVKKAGSNWLCTIENKIIDKALM